jgi:large subunit ribosomal protein L9
MKVILLEKIAKLGSLGNVVDVKAGFARNFLLPQKKALRVSEENLAIFEKKRKDLEIANEETKKVAEGIAAKIDGKEIVIIKQASEAGVLYGSVSTKEIAEELDANLKVEIVKSQILLNQPIKEVGVHSVKIRLHPEVVATIKVNVAITVEEAKKANKPSAKKSSVEENKSEEILEKEEASDEESVKETDTTEQNK